jgi:hypothetical protein
MAASSTIEAFSAGQRVRTGFGTGIISAVSHIDSIIYVALSREPSALYLLRPEQVETLDSEA